MYRLDTMKDGKTRITLTLNIKSVSFIAPTRKDAIIKGLEALRILRGI